MSSFSREGRGLRKTSSATDGMVSGGWGPGSQPAAKSPQRGGPFVGGYLPMDPLCAVASIFLGFAIHHVPKHVPFDSPFRLGQLDCQIVHVPPEFGLTGLNGYVITQGAQGFKLLERQSNIGLPLLQRILVQLCLNSLVKGLRHT